MQEANNRKDSPIFLYEVVFPNPGGSFTRRFSRVILRVPRNRMGAETKRILREGGTILAIKPLSIDGGVPETVPDVLPWWVEIGTEEPRCLYYFGPFDSYEEALSNQAGYIEDLESESAIGIVTAIKQCQPEILTIEDF
ncbi:DUF1816 domain-containing protein [Pannus brasiliensis CCIBt3594]|uniref:DUF1816 domain-containing protein n=1 Tax=Pannus brasiliensis CCIBt3594 TaxID=1427578 RepID=A0AAW9QFW7_9CHRO